MPLSDYVNFNPAPEATGGYNPGGLGVTADDLLNASRAIDFYNQANTMGVTPFEANQIYRNQLNPTSVSTGYAASGAVETNPFLGAILGPTNISATGTAGGLPANIFQGPLPTMGGAGFNAMYNLGSAGLNYVNNLGVNQVALGNLPAGNVGIETGFNPNYPNLSTAGVTITNPAEMTGNVTFDTGAANIGQGDVGGRGAMTVGNALTGGPASAGASDRLSMVGGPTALGAFNVNESLLPSASLGTGIDIKTTPSSQLSQPPSILSGVNTPASTGTTSTSSGVSTLPAYNVNDVKQTDAQYQQALEEFKRLHPDFQPSGVQLPAFPVVDTRIRPTTTASTTASTTATTTGTTRIALDTSKITPPVNFVGPVVRPGTTTSQTTVSTNMTTTGTGTTDMTGGITYDPNAGKVAAATGQRDVAAELAKTIPALYGQYNFGGQQGTIMDQYTKMYQGLLGQTAIPQAAQSSLQQMALDQAKLQRIQSGQMNAEDVRNAQQAAREAYGARGQVMGQGAIGAEILNREAIRQQREDQARAAYQASMGNVFNAAQLQTGNIFSPIGQLVSGTFNPLGAYPQDVYSSNYNAQLARDISAANNAASIEAAKYGATQAKQAATTGAVGNILAKILGLG